MAEQIISPGGYEKDLTQIYKRLAAGGGGGGGGAPLVHHTRHEFGGADPIKLDDLNTPDDNTNLDASDAAHGLLIKAVAPAAGLLNIVGIENGETAWFNKPLFDATNPASLGAVDPGTSLTAARRDHVHAMPKLDDLDTPDDNTDLDATPTEHGLLPKLPDDPALFIDGEGIWSPIHGPRILELVDDFVPAAGGTYQNFAGALNWTKQQSGTGETQATKKGEALHPGINNLRTYTALSSWTAILLENALAGNEPIWADDIFCMIAILRVPVITSISILFGWAYDHTALDCGANSCFFRFNPATSANWRCVTRTASTSTEDDSGIAVGANNWYQLEIRRISAASWKFYINGSEITNHTTNLPTGEAGVPLFKVSNLVGGAGTQRTLDVDYFYFRSKDLGNRWT